MADLSIFYQGPLYEAIALAMEPNYDFAALVVDDSDASKLWEEEYLKDIDFAIFLRSRTIPYRIAAESPEAVHLFAFLPRPEKFPCLVVLRSDTRQVESIGVADGDKSLAQLKEWAERVLQRTPVEPLVQDPAPPPPPPADPVLQDPARLVDPPTQARRQEATPPIASTPTPPSNIYDPTTTQSRNPPTAKDKGKNKPSSGDSSSSATTAPPKNNEGYIAAERKRAQEANSERERVKKLLEADKAMRAAREKEAREARERDRSGAESFGASGAQGKLPGARLDSKECALSFRLLDGSALKHRFPADVKLGVEVRKWIDQNRPDETNRPYTFTQLLTPFPNKHISLSEENLSLKAVNLTPSATLVLTPGKTAQASAYPSLGGIPSPWGLASTLTSGVSSVLGMGYNAVTSVLGAATGGTGNNQNQPAAAQQPSTTGATGGSSRRGTPQASRGNGGARIRTLHDSDERGGEGRDAVNKFYNGNQLNFEPNRDGRGGE